MTLTNYPLGIALTNGAITQQQHDAGWHYMWLRNVLFGHGSAAAQNYERLAPGESGGLSDAALTRHRQNYETARAALMATGRRTFEVTENIVVYQRIPRWMRPVPPKPSDVTEAALFVKGLTALADSASRWMGRAA